MRIKHNRRTIRLKNHDYASSGAYFVTICTYNRQCLLGEIINDNCRGTACCAPNKYGKIVDDELQKTSILREYVNLDEYIIMPNHIHGIIIINGLDNIGNITGTARRAPTFGESMVAALSTIIRSFKSAATRRINELRKTPGMPVWQRNYYERIIRNERELNTIREYIMKHQSTPCSKLQGILLHSINWAEDRENLSRC